MFPGFAELSSFFSRKTRKRFSHLMFLRIRRNEFPSTHRRMGSGTKVRKKIKMADQAMTVRMGPSLTWG